MEIRPLETDKIICVKVGKVARENLYEMTRKYWVMKLERAEKATHVLAIINGTVIGPVVTPPESNAVGTNSSGAKNDSPITKM